MAQLSKFQTQILMLDKDNRKNSNEAKSYKNELEGSKKQLEEAQNQVKKLEHSLTRDTV